MTNEKILELASIAEKREKFEDTFIGVIHNYDSLPKDKECLALLGCAIMTGKDHVDKQNIEKFLHTVQDRTHSVFEYIDYEMYRDDYKESCLIYSVLNVIHALILSTGSVENYLKVSLDYNEDPVFTLCRTFHNHKVLGIFPLIDIHHQQKAWTFMRMMVRDEPVDLHLWKDWICPAELQVPIDRSLLAAACRLGITKNDCLVASTREEVTNYFRMVFPDDPAKGYYVLKAYADIMDL